MRVLIAEDDSTSRCVLQTMLTRWGYETVVACDGQQAWEELQQKDAPQLAIMDWMMPFLDGVEVCRMARQASATKSIYIMLLTARGNKSDIVTGLEAGADDYLIKPFDREELKARMRVGTRIVELQKKLTDRVKELQDTLSQVKVLQGILPICSHCKKIRDDQNYWQQVEAYISTHSQALFSHGICPDCYDRVVLPEIERVMLQENSAK